MPITVCAVTSPLSIIKRLARSRLASHTQVGLSTGLLYNRESILALMCEVGAITCYLYFTSHHVDEGHMSLQPISKFGIYRRSDPAPPRHLIHAPAFPFQKGTVLESGRLAQALTFQTLCPSRLCAQVQLQDIRVFVLRLFGR